jgi:hypothetical protein
MPASTVLLGFLAEQAASLVVKHARGVLAKMPWARDAQRVQSVERKIALLVDRVATLARNVPIDRNDALLEPLIEDFRKELLQERIAPEEAGQIVDSVRAQIRTEVLRPLYDAAQMVARIEALEREGDEGRGQVAELRRELTAMAEREALRERQLRQMQLLLAVCLTLAAVATLVGLVVLGRR